METKKCYSTTEHGVLTLGGRYSTTEHRRPTLGTRYSTIEHGVSTLGTGYSTTEQPIFRQKAHYSTTEHRIHRCDFKHEFPRIEHEFIINGKLYGQLHGNYMFKMNANYHELVMN